VNGTPSAHTWEIAHALGTMAAEQRRHTEILLGLQERIIELPDRIGDRLAHLNASGPTAPARDLGTLREWIVAATAIGALLATLAGKERVAAIAVEMLRRLLGMA
jgi:hypothetical protein